MDPYGLCSRTGDDWCFPPATPKPADTDDYTDYYFRHRPSSGGGTTTGGTTTGGGGGTGGGGAYAPPQPPPPPPDNASAICGGNIASSYLNRWCDAVEQGKPVFPLPPSIVNQILGNYGQVVPPSPAVTIPCSGWGCVSQAANAAYGFATTVAAPTVSSWLTSHSQLVSTVTNIAVGAAIGIGLEALCIGTAGIGCVAAVGLAAGAAGAFAGTVTGNALTGQNLGTNLLRNTVIGGIAGLVGGAVGGAVLGGISQAAQAAGQSLAALTLGQSIAVGTAVGSWSGIAAGATNQPISVSNAMCSTCQAFFSTLAEYRGQVQVVIDPYNIHIFTP